MRVLMFGWEFPPHNSGGLGVACYGLARALTERDTSVLFVLPKKLPVEGGGIDILFADTDDPRFSLRMVSSELTPYRYSHINSEESLSYSFGTSLGDEVRKYGIAAREIARKEKFDVIHAHDWLSMRAGVEAKKVSKKPLLVHVHATEFDRSGGVGVNEDVYNIESEGFKMADKIITVSEYTKNIVIEKYGVPKEKIEVVHNGNSYMDIDGSDEKVKALLRVKEHGDKIVLFLGRITLQKGPDYFIRTARKVIDVYPRVTFVVAGSGDMERQIVREASRLGLSDKIIFAGFLRGAEQKAMFRAADLYVMPSVSEPFGLVALESLSEGTPVIISKQAGVGEVLKHALKVDFWDTDEMANKIVAVLSHGALYETLRQNGREEARSQTWGKAAEKVIRLYNSLVYT